MANTASAAKRARQTVKCTSRNRKVKAGIKAELKEIRSAITGGKKDEAKISYQRAYAFDKTLTEAKEAADRIKN